MSLKKVSKWLNRVKKWFKGVFHQDEDTSFNVVEVTVVVIISILFGIIVGCILTYGNGYAKSGGDKKLEEFADVYQTIIDNYYDDVDKDDLINAAIDGMTSALGDAHSYYMDSDETKYFNQQIDGSYVGIGVTIAYSDTGDYVADIFKDSPAAKAGFEVGDVILEVDNTSVVGYELDKLSESITKKKGEKVVIKVRRGDREKKITVVNDTIIIPSVSSREEKVDGKNVGYINISTFAANTYEQFNEELKRLEKAGIDGLIIDVRNNSGGHLSQVTDILSLFFNKDTILYKMSTKGRVTDVYSSTKDFRKYKIVVLVNYSSASASEILAASFKDSYANSVVIGTNSYGKGTVQTVLDLPDGSSLKYTKEEWLTGNGESIDGIGISPDKVIEQDIDIELGSADDAQYKAALGEFSN